MDNVHHEKEEEGVFYGDFSFITEGVFSGSFEAKCSQVCLNIILQKARFTEGLTVTMDDQALTQALDSLHIRAYFGITELTEMEDLFLVNWGQGQQEVFGSLLALYQVLKSERLHLLPLTATLHPAITAANLKPESVRGYLYLLDHHWMVLRQLGRQWYKFDPWLGGPQLLTHFYVSLYVKQLIADGKLVFVIDGEFPRCPADLEEESLQPHVHQPTDKPGKPSIDLTEQEISESLRFLDLVFENEDNELALALLLSLEDDHRKNREEEELNKVCGIVGSEPSVVTNTLSTCPAVTASGSGVMHSTSSSSVTTPSVQLKVPPERFNCEFSSIRDLKFFANEPAGETAGTDMKCTSDIGCGIARRRNGTTVSPLLTEPDAKVTDISCDSEDLSHPFNIMFEEPGDGVRCLDTPELPYFNEPSDAGGVALRQAGAVPEALLIPRPTVPPPPPPPQCLPTPRVFITSSDRSSFKKVVPTTGPPLEEEEDEGAMCCVCWVEPPSHVVVPCGHFCLCATCSANILQLLPVKPVCPLCKQETTSIIKIFK